MAFDLSKRMNSAIAKSNAVKIGEDIEYSLVFYKSDKFFEIVLPVC